MPGAFPVLDCYQPSRLLRYAPCSTIELACFTDKSMLPGNDGTVFVNFMQSHGRYTARCEVNRKLTIYKDYLNMSKVILIRLL